MPADVPSPATIARVTTKSIERAEQAGAMSQYAIWHEAFESPDWASLADTLGKELGWNRTEARCRVRRTGGILLENLDADAAERCRAACAEMGVTVAALPQSSVVVLPRPLRVHEVSLGDDALVVRVTDRDPEVSIAWERILLLAAFQTTHVESYHNYRTVTHGQRAAVDLKIDRVQEQRPEPFVDLFYTMPTASLDRIRLLSREMNYTRILGADAPDPHVTIKSRLAGFRLVVARIGTRASRAVIPPETLCFLGGDKAAEGLVKLRNLDDFDTYNRWLLQTLQIAEA
ncbi:MAG TPA: hypothetical protein VG125_05915 [Pirellulales bacterium]|nr:hypothetical protein [Pirellulales bacterium]